MSVVLNFSDLDLSKKYSYADYLKWQFSERVELLKGCINKMSPAPSKTHQVISRKLTRYLDRYLEHSPCGFFVAPFDVRLSSKNVQDEQIYTVVQPDLCVVCDLNKLDERGCFGAPDLVIEILSVGNSKTEMGEKFRLYEENQVKEYWLVKPIENTIFVYTLNNGQFIGLKPCIEGEKIKSVLFPDLIIEIDKIFEP